MQEQLQLAEKAQNVIMEATKQQLAKYSCPKAQLPSFCEEHSLPFGGSTFKAKMFQKVANSFPI